MPKFMREWLRLLTREQKDELAKYVCTTDDNEITTDIMLVVDPSDI